MEKCLTSRILVLYNNNRIVLAGNRRSITDKGDAIIGKDFKCCETALEQSALYAGQGISAAGNSGSI